MREDSALQIPQVRRVDRTGLMVRERAVKFEVQGKDLER